MPRIVRRIASDDAVVKLLFDHVRNLVLCGVVWVAAVWNYRLGVAEAESTVALLMQWFAMAVLIIAGAFLFLVNLYHGLEKLRGTLGKRHPMALVAYFVYSLVAVSVVISVVTDRS